MHLSGVRAPAACFYRRVEGSPRTLIEGFGPGAYRYRGFLGQVWPGAPNLPIGPRGLKPLELSGLGPRGDLLATCPTAFFPAKRAHGMPIGASGTPGLPVKCPMREPIVSRMSCSAPMTICARVSPDRSSATTVNGGNCRTYHLMSEPRRSASALSYARRQTPLLHGCPSSTPAASPPGPLRVS